LYGFRNNIPLYLLILPALVFTAIFAYIPLFGLIVAFKDFDLWKGFLASPWAAHHGFQHIMEIFTFKPMYKSIFNTLYLSILGLLVGFPAPIVLALLFNELKLGRFKKTVQTVSYMPYFLSWISVIGISIAFFDSYGPLNGILSLIAPSRERILYLSNQGFFVPLIIGLGLWKGVGWGSIIYLASIAGIDPQLYEAASIDGASRFQQMRRITLPSIAPTAAIVLILSIGGILGSNFELVYGLQNAFINFETIDTIIYKHGILQRGYSLATAVGFTRGLVALVLMLTANSISKRLAKQAIL